MHGPLEQGVCHGMRLEGCAAGVSDAQPEPLEVHVPVL